MSAYSTVPSKLPSNDPEKDPDITDCPVIFTDVPEKGCMVFTFNILVLYKYG